MRVLVCHVHYREAGGEDAVFSNEVAILRHSGVEVETLALRSEQFHQMPLRDKADLLLHYSDHALGHRLLRERITERRPDVVHFHNIYPFLGPGAIGEARRLGCATVQTLHNHRLSCLAGTHLRRNRICRLCRPEHYLAGVVHACYRRSRLQSALVGRATRRQWRQFLAERCPTIWLSLTEHARDYWVSLGAPPERIVVKPNSVARGEPAVTSRREGVFCGGRLSPEKGFLELIAAWPAGAPALTVAGAGPLEADIEVAAARRANVDRVGWLPHDQMLTGMRQAKIVVMPSICPEPLGLVTLEALAQATPVVSFDGTSLGSVLRQIDPLCTVPYGDFRELARRAAAIAADDALWARLSQASLERWTARYSNEVNEEALLSAYERALALR
jgi:glycosyltransferase involved in cell wall biosynthesis